MYCVFIEMSLDPERADELATYFAGLVHLFRAEPGNLRYECTFDRLEPSKACIFQLWSQRSDYEDHHLHPAHVELARTSTERGIKGVKTVAFVADSMTSAEFAPPAP